MKNTNIQVNEIFGDTIQGEGPYAGKPAIFLRLSGCVPPYCKFCDSKYSWKEKGTSMTARGIVTELEKYKQKFLVITGGEPFLQYQALLPLVKHWTFNNGNDNLQWETSGKVSMNGRWPEGKVICSPKYVNNKWQINMDDPHNWVDAWKFVVANQIDMLRVKAFVKEHWLKTNQIYIMPEGKTRAIQLKRMPKIAEWCAEVGFNFSPRLHVLTWDNRRAV